MAHILYRISSSAANKPTSTSVKGSPLTMAEFDGNLKSIQDDLDTKVAMTTTTGSAIIPVGTTAQRDSSPVNGYLRYNSSTNQFEGYISGSWQPIGSVTSVEISGGTTGLTVTGSPITTSGTITLGGTLSVANGGTGANNAAAARNNLGATTVGNALFTATDANAARTAIDAVGYTATSGSAIIPVGTTAQRDASPANGYLRYNSTTDQFEGYIGGSWQPIGGGAGTVTSVAVSGGTTGLTVTGSPITTSGTITLGGTLAIAHGGTGATNAADARANLGATTVGEALFTATDANAARTAINAVGYTSTTGSAIIPVGTTAQRDSSPVNGYLRYNTTLQKFEGYVNGAWSDIGSGGGLTVSNDTTTDATYYPLWSTSTSGTITSGGVSSTKLTFNPNSGTLSAVQFNATSDVRLKEVKGCVSGDAIFAMRGCSFVWKDTGQQSSGVIAQEIEQIAPELVYEDSEGNKSVNYNGLIAYLIESIKILKYEIDQLKANQ